MAVDAREVFDKLSPERLERIERIAAEMKAEEASLRQLREARRQSQQEVADRLKTTQAAVSRLERRTDVYVSTLRKYVEAMGGTLEITATFPDSRAVKLTQFAEEPEPAR